MQRKKTLTPYKAKVPGLTEREKKPLNTFSSDMHCCLRSRAQRVHILVLRFQAPIRGLWISHRGLLSANERTAPLPPSSLAHPCHQLIAARCICTLILVLPMYTYIMYRDFDRESEIFNCALVLSMLFIC